MSNGFYTGTANTFWDTYAATNTQSITFSAPQLQWATNQYYQLTWNVDRNNRLQAANASYRARVAREAREAREAHERVIAVWAAARERSRREHAEADNLAIQLVKDVLSEEEFALFKRDQYVFVTNEDSGNKYKVRLHGTVLRWRCNKAYISICVIPDYSHTVPAADLFLAKYLLCKYDEDTLLTIGRQGPCY